MMQEMIDVYTQDRCRTGRVVPRGSRLDAGEYMLYVLALVQDETDRFLITQRSLDKSWGAGWWEVPGGGVPAGEDSHTAVVREVSEEVGLDVSAQVAEPIWSYRNDDTERGDNYLVDIYLIRHKFDLTNVHLQAEETINCRLASWDEIGELASQGIFLHYDRIRQALDAARDSATRG